MNILLIDDNPNDLLLNKYALKKKFPNAIYTTAEDMDTFLKKIDWVKPDIIICDYKLRECNGLDILLEVKSRLNIPFIFVTGMLNNEVKTAEAILSGASGYVLKDDLSVLGDVVEKVYLNFQKENITTEENQEKFTKLNMVIEKAINKINNGVETSSILDDLSKAKEIISDFI